MHDRGGGEFNTMEVKGLDSNTHLSCIINTLPRIISSCWGVPLSFSASWLAGRDLRTTGGVEGFRLASGIAEAADMALHVREGLTAINSLFTVLHLNVEVYL
jgi:hypothetical protein